MLHQTLEQITTLSMDNIDITHLTSTPISVTTLITGTHETVPIDTIHIATGIHQDQEGYDIV